MKNRSDNQPLIRRAFIKEIIIYDVTESELRDLENRPDNLYLTFALFLFSIASTLTITFFTSTLIPLVFNIFLMITCIGYIISILLFCLWFLNKKKLKATISDIRKRDTSTIPTTLLH